MSNEISYITGEIPGTTTGDKNMARYQVTDDVNSRMFSLRNDGAIDFRTKTVKSGRYTKVLIVEDSIEVKDQSKVNDCLTKSYTRLMVCTEKRDNGHKRMGLSIEVEEEFQRLLRPFAPKVVEVA